MVNDIGRIELRRCQRVLRDLFHEIVLKTDILRRLYRIYIFFSLTPLQKLLPHVEIVLIINQCL